MSDSMIAGSSSTLEAAFNLIGRAILSTTREPVLGVQNKE